MSEKIFKIINGDSLEELKKFPDNYFDSVVTDPPYGLGKEPDATEMLKAWVETGYMEVKGTGFMGKKWDAFVPQPLFWKEVFRVLKHGGHVVSFFGTRTYDWGCMAIRLAGFEIRDSIQFAFDDSKYRDEFIKSLTKEQRISLGQILKNGENIALWNYGSGFPKSHNIGKAIDKMYGAKREVIGKSDYTIPKSDNSMRENSYGISGGKLANGTTAERITPDITAPSTEDAKKWDGWGSALKPAVEPIVLARKPLEKGLSIAENVLKWGTGGINIDGCRVKTNDKYFYPNGAGGNGFHGGVGRLPDGSRTDTPEMDINGRFPANLLMSHHPDCCFNGTKKVKAIKGGNGGSDSMNEQGYGFKKIENGGNAGGLGDENGEETVEDWTCVDGCPVKIMDEQSGESKSVGGNQNNRITDNSFISGVRKTISSIPNGYGDVGGASRFFYTAKASKSERNFGLEELENKSISDKKGNGLGRVCNVCGENQLKKCDCERNTYVLPPNMKNNHPTVKPIKLMQYLAKLITPPNGKVLDPFNGSGTTGIACSLEGFEYTGIELDAEYCKISEARIKAWNEIEEYEQYKKIIENQEEEKVLEKLGGKQTNLFED